MSQQYFDKFEWWDVCRQVKPDLTWEEFEKLWDERSTPPAEQPN